MVLVEENCLDRLERRKAGELEDEFSVDALNWDALRGFDRLLRARTECWTEENEGQDDMSRTIES